MDEPSDSDAFRFPGDGGVLSAEFVRSLPPVFQGYCEKESHSLMSFLFPYFFPRWKKRYIMTCGNFLLRYEDENGGKPKGVPIPLDASAIVYRDNSSPDSLDDSEDGKVLEITNLWKDYRLRFETERECKQWVQVLRTRRLESIREGLGHLHVEPRVKLVNDEANRRLQRKLRTDAALHRSEEVFNPISFGHA